MKELLALAWTDHYFAPDHLRPRTATVNGETVRLEFTLDRSRLPEVDAVWLHGPSIEDLPEKREGQPWVLMSMESEIWYPYQRVAESDDRFDVHMTYRLDSDIPTLYGNWQEYANFEAPVPPHRGPSKGAVAVYMASNPVAFRDDYVAELMDHLPVDSVGRCLNNRDIVEVGGPGGVDHARQAAAVARAYKFVLAFENSIAVDYVTEKLYRALACGAVPVHLGAPNVRDFTPADESVIVVDDFGSPADLAAHLMELDADDAAYARHHRWRVDGVSTEFHRLMGVGSVDPMARLAAKLVHGCDRSCGCGGRLRDPGRLP